VSRAAFRLLAFYFYGGTVNQEQALQVFDKLQSAIQEVESIRELKEIKNKIEALRVYFRENDEGQRRLATGSLWAQRRMGEILKEMPKATGGDAQRARFQRATESTPETYAEMGLDKTAAHRYQKLAELPEDKFKEYVEDKTKDINTSGALKIANRLSRDTLKKQIIKPPEGKYSTIVIDPPWEMEKIEREVAPNQVGFDYPTMTIDEIKDFETVKNISNDDCHLFLWTTQKYLPVSFDVLKAWGFKYVFTMTWHKDGGFQPFNLPQYNSEFVVYGRVGTPEFTSLKQFFTCFNGKRRGHSRKPKEFYDILRRVTPEPRIDIFNREKIEGFKGWGNEEGKYNK
jgi:N6-adenosine-specific RNA methylase IME4